MQVLFAFMVGLHNLYWYYGTQIYSIKKDGRDRLVHSSEAFQGSAVLAVLFRDYRRQLFLLGHYNLAERFRQLNMNWWAR